MARLINTFKNGTLTDAYTAALNAGLAGDTFGWILDDGTEVLRVESAIYVAETSGRVIRDTYTPGMTVKDFVARMRRVHP